MEKAPKAVACLRANRDAVAKSVGVPAEKVMVSMSDVLDWQPPPGTKVDLVFIDPPYELIEYVAPRLFERFRAWFNPDDDVLVVFEMPGEVNVAAEGWVEVKRLGRKGGRQPTAAIFRQLKFARS